MKKFCSFKDARAFVRKLGLKSNVEYGEYCKSGNKPDNIPFAPQHTFKYDGWIGWRDWLGTDFRSFESARKFTRTLKFNRFDEWKTYCKSAKKPEDIPVYPNSAYKNKWTNWEDWLGTDGKYTKNKKFRSFESSRKFVQTLNIRSKNKYNQYVKSEKFPKDIPRYPNEIYTNKWINWGDWLGHERIADQLKQYRDFESARKFVRKLGLKSQSEWREYYKSGNKPDDIPANAYNSYRDKGWINWGDWLGHERISDNIKSENYLPWTDAKPIYRKLAKEYGLKNGTDWEKFRKSHKKLLEKLNLPQLPDRVYSKERVWRKIK